VKNITNGIFICHKQVNNNTKSNSYSLKRQQNYFCNGTHFGDIAIFDEEPKVGSYTTAHMFDGTTVKSVCELESIYYIN